MNRADLVNHIADITNLSKADTGKAVDAMFDAIRDALARGEEFTQVGFGSFSVTERAAREGRNPKTGETIQIPAGKALKFKAGKVLKGVVNA